LASTFLIDHLRERRKRSNNHEEEKELLQRKIHHQKIDGNFLLGIKKFSMI